MSPSDDSEVQVLPSGIRVSVAPGETVMAAANREGYYWPTICKGNGLCARCVMTVKEGAENFAPMRAEERATLDRIRGTASADTERLACQAQICGPVTVQRRGVRSVEALAEG